jgi:uncharacterized membrane protein YtjA (UPF0391 family)
MIRLRRRSKSARLFRVSHGIRFGVKAHALASQWDVQGQSVGPELQLRKPGGKKEVLHWTLVFLIIALIAGALGLFGVAGMAASIAKVLFFVFLVIWLVSLVTRRGAI